MGCGDCAGLDMVWVYGRCGLILGFSREHGAFDLSPDGMSLIYRRSVPLRSENHPFAKRHFQRAVVHRRCRT
jgi:hypothetical protein